MKFAPHFVATTAWLLFGGWFIGLNLLSSLPASDLPPVFLFPHADKVLHFCAFFAGAALLCLALRTTPWPPLRLISAALLAFLVVGIIGLFDEVRQLLTPGRDGANALDMLANLTGAFCGAFCTSHLYGRLVCLLQRN